MGPYYRGTSQGIGNFFDSFYQHPIVMLLLAGVLVATCLFFWSRNKSG
jgi:hypothetical protein